jgi:hypothetical protein
MLSREFFLGYHFWYRGPLNLQELTLLLLIPFSTLYT